jgi:hypothetical protein
MVNGLRPRLRSEGRASAGGGGPTPGGLVTDPLTGAILPGQVTDRMQVADPDAA